jgi:hypothetical protein
MPSITTFTICTRSPVSTYCGGTLIGIVDGYASDLFCCSAATGGTFSVWLGLRPSPATAAPPCKVLGGIIGAWDVISSKRSLSYQPWAPWFPPLLSKEGGSNSPQQHNYQWSLWSRPSALIPTVTTWLFKPKTTVIIHTHTHTLITHRVGNRRTCSLTSSRYNLYTNNNQHFI